ncbi:MAG: VCBS repeat-containing protein [Planctomycetales bacterium]|nr:VCBS repeat-containing protein [Planctomycetales bacterium]
MLLVTLLLSLSFSGYWLTRPRPDADELLEAAKAALHVGDDQSAVRILDKLLSHAPENGQALLYRGQLAFDREEHEAAYSFFHRVPDSPASLGSQARYAEGVLLVAQGFGRAGEQLLQRALELDPSSVAARQRLVELYLAQMRSADVRKQLDAIRYLRPWSIDELVLYTIVGAQPGNRQNGPEQIERFLDAAPDDPPMRLVLARYRFADGRVDEAIELASPLLDNQEYAARAAAIIADSHIHNQDFGAAAHVISKLGEHSQPDAAVYRVCGRLAAEYQDWDTAVACLAEATKSNRENLETAHRLGIALSRLGAKAANDQLQYATRLDHILRQASRLPNRNANAPEPMIFIMLDVANTLIEVGRPRDAAYWYDQILTIDSTNEVAKNNLSKALSVASNSLDASKAPTLDEMPTIPWDSMLAYARNKGTTIQRPSNDSRGLEVAVQLRDVHDESLLTFNYFNGDTGMKYLLESMGGGVAVLDFDQDGWPDLYVTQGCKLPYDPADQEYRDRLFRNLGDGTFRDVTELAGLGCNRYGQGCTAGDFDNDGYPDLFVGNYGANVLYKNNGDGTFDDITLDSRITGDSWTASVGFADFDGDGNLDLYVVNYLDALRVCRGVDGRIAACDPQNFNGQQDHLFANLGNGEFSDITSQSGIEVPGGKGLGLLLADLDYDGMIDVYVANDGTPNFLFRNVSRDGIIRFEECGLTSGVAVNGDGQSEGGMGIAFGDLDNDGLEDLYVTNFLDETNTLYRNLGGMLFHDVSRQWGTDDASTHMVGFGAQAIDFDLDGRSDLLVANGHIDDFRFRDEPWKMASQVFRNMGETLRDVSPTCGEYFLNQGLGRGVARLDWDRDGDDDAVVIDQSGPAALLSNETRDKGNWIAFRLQGRHANRDAIGARIEIRSGGKIWRRSLVSGDGYFSSNERVLRFGLGEANDVRDCTVVWPHGQIQRIETPQLGSSLTVVEPPSSATRIWR